MLGCTDDVVEMYCFFALHNYTYVQSFTPLEFQKDLVEKTHILFPSLPHSHLASLLTHSNAVSAYDAVWTMAFLWSSLLNTPICDNDAKLTDQMEQVLVNISVSICICPMYMCIRYNYENKPPNLLCIKASCYVYVHIRYM